jgi:hypothetical protein
MLAAFCHCAILLFRYFIAMKFAAVAANVFLVVVDITLIVLYVFHIGVAFRPVVPQVAFVLAFFSPVFGESRSVAGALVARNLSPVLVHFVAIPIDIFLILLHIADVLVTVAAILAQIAAILVKVFSIFWNIGRILSECQCTRQHHESCTQYLSSHLSLS